MSTAACNHVFGGACQFKPLCFGAEPVTALLERYGQLGFKPRTPHHAPELIQNASKEGAISEMDQ
jgi:hypothetical protein